MSENKKPGNKRLHLVFAIAVLIGAIIMLIAMERASKTTDHPPPEAPKSGSTTTPPSTSAASPSPGVASANPDTAVVV
ncbi:MAG: hypothetical protein IAE82_20360, partial [Opitutaceae bacterium]|nr:hypothetical protein [Opitutaceae bacterium]